MRRTACVDLPAFPLQLLLKRHADWGAHPAAVVDSDRPQGVLLWVNERARALGVLPGMRYVQGVSLAGALRAGVVPQSEIESELAALVRRLQRWTPGVQPAEDEPGVFWLDASGFERLHGSPEHWAGKVREDLERSGWKLSVVVGFTRFGSYAVARSSRSLTVFDREAKERDAARRVPLARLAVEPTARDALRKLGIVTLGEFVELPAEGIERRFGKRIGRLHRQATGLLQLPLQPEPILPPVARRRLFDHPETKIGRLIPVIEQLLEPLLGELSGRLQAVAELHVGFRFERTGDHIETIRPAAPTLDGGSLLELVRLRLQAVRRLPDGVAELLLSARGISTRQKQTDLFADRPRRDLAAANRALARVRAELGERSVTQAVLREGHLPEGSFTWEPLNRLAAACPRSESAADGNTGRLIRRIYERPVPLPSRARHEPDGWMLRGLEQGPVVRVLGPYVVSGGWWNRPVHREYHFAETQKGELLWVYYDRPRRRWYLQGRVE